ncbi:MAG: FxsA family protein [Alphaproteobacteria bacterium]
MPLLIAFILIPLLEIAVFIQVGDAIGLGFTILGILLTAFIGLGLIRAQGLAAMTRAQEQMQAGKPPVKEILTGACLLIAGALLLTPGFVTDTIGFLLLTPVFRAVMGATLLKGILQRGGMVDIHANMGDTANGNDDGFTRHDRVTVIDGDFEEVSPQPQPNSAQADGETDSIK